MYNEVIKRGPGRPKKSFSDKLESKAVNSYSGTYTSIQANIPDSVQISSNPIDLMSYSKGYVFACNDKISQTLSNMIFKLYMYKKDNSKILFSKSISKLSKNRINLEKKATSKEKGMEIVELEEHPFLDLINNPYDGMTISQFFYLISSYLGLIGNCYIYKHIIDREIKALQILESEYISIRYDNTGHIIEYIYQPRGTRLSATFLPDQIVHIKNITAGSVIVGRGNLESCLDAFSVCNSSLNYTKTLLSNYCVPGSFITVKNKIGNTEAAKKMALEFANQFGGISRGRNMVTFGDIDIKNMTSSLNDNLTDKFVEISKKEICACFGVPLDLIDTTNSNKASSQVAIQSMMKFGVYPKLFCILDQLNNQIVKPYFNEDLLFWVDTVESMETDPVEQANLYKLYKDMGILTVEEIREKLGFESK